MEPLSETSWLTRFLAFLLTVVSIMGGWLFRGLHKRIDEVKIVADRALPREEFQAMFEQSVKDREDLRDRIRELFGRDDKLKDLIHEQFALMRRELADQIRDQFSLVRSEVAERRKLPRR